MVCTAGRGPVRPDAPGTVPTCAVVAAEYRRTTRPSFPQSTVAPPSTSIWQVSRSNHRRGPCRHRRTPKHPQYGKSPPPCRAPFGSLRGETTRPPTSGSSKKRVRLRFNLRPRGSRQTSNPSTWGDVKGLCSGTLPIRFKTQTCAIFSRAVGPVTPNRPLLAPRTPHLHTFGGYNAPSVHRSRAQARDA